MFALLATAALGYAGYSYWKKHHATTAVTPIAFAQTSQAIGMALAHDQQAGADLTGLDNNQLTIAYMRGNLTEITNAIAVLLSRKAMYTAEAFKSRAAQLMTPPKH